MDNTEYIVRDKVSFSYMNDDEIRSYKKRQRIETNKKHYLKRKKIELYYKDSYEDICYVLNNGYDNCSEEEIDLFLECKRICEEELKIDQ